MSDKIVKSEAEWRDQLTAEQYYVTREHGTERAFTGRLDKHYEDGTYHCICCDTALFSSETKFNSGSGWPSFYDKLGGDAVGESEDTSLLCGEPRSIARGVRPILVMSFLTGRRRPAFATVSIQYPSASGTRRISPARA